MSFDKGLVQLGARRRAEPEVLFDVIIIRPEGDLMTRSFRACTKWHAIELAYSCSKHVQADRTQYDAKKRGA